MGTATERMGLAEATVLAQAVVGLLTPYCEEICIAGSVRRKAPTCGDIEIVCIPKIEQETGGTLFGDDVFTVNRLDDHIEAMLVNDELGTRLDKNGRRAVGERYKRLSYFGFGLDLFSVVAPAQFGVIMAIRTGPSEWSHRLVMSRTQPFRIQGPSDRSELLHGMLPPGYRVKDGQLFGGDGRVIDTPTEESFFDAISLPYLAPEDRR